MCLAVAAAGVAYPLVWQHHQVTVGSGLVRADQARARRIERSGTAGSRSCPAQPGPGVLDIPSLHVAAPVEQGLTDPVLAVALGHDPSTPWPGPGSSSLIAGHDVGYLSADTALVPGDTFSYAEPCATLHYTVTGHKITSPGQQVTLPRGGGIVLDSCWPTDALWFTSQRYLVIARYDSMSAGSTSPAAAPPPSLPGVHLPSGLAATSLTLTTNSWPMGTLHVSGTPAPSWTASQAALDVAGNALELLFGLRHALSTGQAGWLGTLAPGVSVPSWLGGAPDGQLDVTETVTGTGVTAVTLRSTVQSTSVPTHFVLVAGVHGNAMVVTSVRATP
ncbi:MAG: sortase domain-containing protein [Acidimicrobiales bacterium]